MGLSGNSKGHDGAVCHAVFRSLEEVVTERSSRVKPNDQMQIIQRCQEYNPEVRVSVTFGRHVFQYSFFKGGKAETAQSALCAGTRGLI